MRTLISALAVGAALLTAAPAAAQSYSGDYRINDDWRQYCHRDESAAACRNRLQQRRDTRYGDYPFDYRQDYPRDLAPYAGYYEERGDYVRRQHDQSYGGYDRGYGDYGYDQRGYYDERTYGGGYYDQRGGGYGGDYGYRDDSGAALALLVLGVALGVQILGTDDDRRHYDRWGHDRDWQDWCRNRYRGFDWRSGTYQSDDGYRRYCRRG